MEQMKKQKSVNKFSFACIHTTLLIILMCCMILPLLVGCVDNDAGDGAVTNTDTEASNGNQQETVYLPASEHYIRYTVQGYAYSIKYKNTETGETAWVNATLAKRVRGLDETIYYYYMFTPLEGYDSMTLFIYEAGKQAQQQEISYVRKSSIVWNEQYDTYALINDGGTLKYSWSVYEAFLNGKE